MSDVATPAKENRISRKDLIDETLPLGVDPKKVLKKGYLIKMGHVVKNWKRRLFVLDAETLSYFKAEKLRGFVPVSKITRIVSKMDSKGRSNGFEVQTSDGKTFLIMAENETERSSWLAAIRRAQFETQSKLVGGSTSNKPHTEDGLTRFMRVIQHSESSTELVNEIEEFKSFITDTNKRRLLALAGHSPYTDISQLVTKSGASKRAAWTPEVNAAFQILLKDIKRVLTENCIIPITEVDFYEEYDFFEELGQGSFATVFRCKNKSTGEEYAVKKIEKKKLTKEDDWALRNEVSIMSQLRHPNIVQLEVAYESKNCYFLVMELVTGGELFERLLDKRSYSEREARNLVRILLEALAFCHRKSVVHRDLKPENILLSNIYDDAAIKIADFGFAQKITPGGLNTDCGSPWYVAPEILLAKPYDTSVDMWSLGVIVYILLCGYPPFHDDNQLVLFNKIKKGRYKFDSPNWDGISTDAKNLISQLLVLDPRRRLSVEQALKHPWIVGEKVPSNDLDVALGKLRSFKQRRGFTIKQGIIRKRGGIIPRWQDRCFVLTPETLSYYVSEHSQTARGEIPLESIQGVDVEEKEPNTISIRTTTGRSYKLEFNNEEELREWHDIITNVQQGHMLCRSAKAALEAGNIAQSFEDADKARKMPDMRRSPILMEVWSSLAEHANRAQCQGVWYQRSLHEVHSSNVTCVAWSQDGKMVATGSSDCKILVWDAKSGEMISSCNGHQGAVQAITFVDSSKLFSGSSDKTAALWDTASGKRLQRFVRHRDNVSTVAASLDGSVLISGGWDKKIILWDVKTGGHVRECRGVHSKSVTAVAVSADGVKAISGSSDRRVGIWDLRTGQPLFTFAGHSDVITSVAITADGRTAVSSSADGSMNSWDTEQGKLALRFNDPDVPPPIPKDEATAATAAAAATGGLGADAFMARGHAGSIHATAISVRGDFVLSAGADRTIKLWNVATGALVERVDTEPEEVGSLALTPHGGLFVVAVKNTVEHWVLDWVLEYKGSLYGTGTGQAQRVMKPIPADSTGADGELVIIANANTMAQGKAASGVISNEEAAHIKAVNERLRQAADEDSDSEGFHDASEARENPESPSGSDGGAAKAATAEEEAVPAAE